MVFRTSGTRDEERNDAGAITPDGARATRATRQDPLRRRQAAGHVASVDPALSCYIGKQLLNPERERRAKRLTEACDERQRSRTLMPRKRVRHGVEAAKDGAAARSGWRVESAHARQLF